jgi:hypothetical protein
MIEWLINRENDPKASFRCDTEVILELSAESEFYQISEDLKRYYAEEVYGRSVTTHEPKGIVVLQIPEALLPEEGEQ